MSYNEYDFIGCGDEDTSQECAAHESLLSEPDYVRHQAKEAVEELLLVDTNNYMKLIAEDFIKNMNRTIETEKYESSRCLL